MLRIESVTILDVNHSIPQDLVAGHTDYPLPDLVGLFHCGNTDPGRLTDPSMKYQVIMNRLMEPEGEPDITRGTIEGRISASPITVLQVYGNGDDLQAYIIEGKFLDLDPKTFGCTGTAYLRDSGGFTGMFCSVVFITMRRWPSNIAEIFFMMPLNYLGSIRSSRP